METVGLDLIYDLQQRDYLFCKGFHLGHTKIDCLQTVELELNYEM